MRTELDFGGALRGIEPPEGSNRRAREHLDLRLPAERGRQSPKALRTALAIVLVGALCLTPAGQAAVGAVAGLFSIGDPEELPVPAGVAGLPGTVADISSGEFPDGTPYSVRVTRIGGSNELCFGINLRDAAEGSAGGYADCGVPKLAKHSLSRLTYFPLERGGTAAFGLAGPEITDATVTGGGEASVVPIRGRIEHAGGPSEQLPPMSFVAVWLPPGVRPGDATAARLNLLDDAQRVVASTELNRSASGRH